MLWGAHDPEQNYDFIIIQIAMATERKKRHRAEFGLNHYFGCHGNRKTLKTIPYFMETERHTAYVYISKTVMIVS